MTNRITRNSARNNAAAAAAGQGPASAASRARADRRLPRLARWGRGLFLVPALAYALLAFAVPIVYNL
ncbi:MAG: hypothetical protein LBI49_22445, partial [Nocardiopsaceae bacterium]|nr:hypothetical protein [Nocardiopsaceae bacterium]